MYSTALSPQLIGRSAWAVPLAIAAALWGSRAAAADPPNATAPPRPRVAVGRFEVPEGLAKEVAPGTLSALLREYGGGGLRYEAVVAAGELERVIDWYRTSGKLPTAGDLKLSQVDFATLVERTRFLLLPTVSKLGDGWVMTADLIDMRSGQARVAKSTRKGGDAGELPGLAEALWRELDAPPLWATFAGHEGQVPGLAYHPGGGILASAGLDRTVRLWDVRGKKAGPFLKGHGGKVVSVAFSADGKLLASGSWDQTVRLWDGETGADRGTLQGHTYYVDHVSFGPDGTLASGAWDGTVRLWDVAGKREKAVLVASDAKNYEAGAAFHPNGKLVATTGGGLVRLWTVPDGKPVTTLKDHVNYLERVGFSPDGRRLATVSKTANPDRWEVNLWHGRTAGYVTSLRGHPAGINAVAFRPDGTRLAAALRDGTIWLWDTTGSGEPKATLRGHTGDVVAVAFSPDGRLLASGSRDGSVRLWDAATGLERAALREQLSVAAVVAFAPDGGTVAAAFWDGAVRLWDLIPPR
ncbi:MAG TPA: WD40 repeat domain-containing protein [Urbifossiella sp.]|nr:WD40 repeat domain-containing protein [Urbifossiella sp.]